MSENQIMSFDDFASGVLYLFPNALLSVAENGEIEISTGLGFAEDGSGNVVPLPEASD